MMDKDKMDKK